MTPLSDQNLYELLLVLIALLVGGYALFGALRALRGSRPGFAVGAPIAVAFGTRVLAAIGLGQLSVAQELRGGDELGVPCPSRGCGRAAPRRPRLARQADLGAARVPVLRPLSDPRSGAAREHASRRDDHLRRARDPAAERGRLRAGGPARGDHRRLDPGARADQRLLLEPPSQGAADVPGGGAGGVRRRRAVEARRSARPCFPWCSAAWWRSRRDRTWAGSSSWPPPRSCCTLRSSASAGCGR